MKPLFAFALFALLTLSGCASTRPSPQALVKNGSHVLLLGEVHDSADGHRARLAYLRSLVDAGWRPVIAMEQFDREKQGLLDTALHDCKNAECIVATPGLAVKGWDWDFYKPVLELALQYRLRVLAVNLSREEAGRVMRTGFTATFDSATVQARGLDKPLPESLLNAQQQEIIVGHCNKLPPNLVPGMTNAQIARDIWMAQLIAPHAAQGVVLLAGNGHVREDIGVPYWLRQSGMPQAISSIDFGTPSPEQGCDFALTSAPKPAAK